MNRNLYFIPLLAQAYADRNPAEALARALAEIKRLGQLDEYRIGFDQFKEFMAEAYCAQVPTVRLEREGVVLSELTPCLATQEVRIPGIEPGNYAVRLSTGRVLWSGRIEASDVQWTAAFPSAALPLAADTGEAEEIPTRELKLLQDEIRVCIYPGIENGTIGIRIDRWKPHQM